MKVSVSILSVYDRLISTINKLNQSKADFIHVDVMDGRFVEDTKFPIEVVKDIMSVAKKPLDVHLMVDDYETVEKYADLKPDMITFHVEIIDDFELIDYVKSLGIKVGLAINPETDVDRLTPYLDYIDLVLFMSVNPGRGGQPFKEEVIEKVKKLKEYAPEDLIISIDGGVNDKTVSLCKYAGCDMVVAGSYITKADDMEGAINNLKSY